MRNRWCNKLAQKGWGKITRTRIALRRQLLRNPTYEEVEAAINSNRKFEPITASDIAKAFRNGDEVRGYPSVPIPLTQCTATAPGGVDNEMRWL